ncbi:MAG: transposase [Ktedonobacteraceae bacterium]
METEEQEKVQKLCQSHPEVELAYDLVQQFARMLRTRTGEHLETWLAKVVDSQISELQSFVAGIERDKAAVKAGLTLPQSNGLVKGKVHTQTHQAHGLWPSSVPFAPPACTPRLVE